MIASAPETSILSLSKEGPRIPSRGSTGSPRGLVHVEFRHG
jgi:hypothetical protein